MKYNVQELYNLIREKRENALNDLTRERCQRKYPSTKRQYMLQGEIAAYTDICVIMEHCGLIKTEDDNNDNKKEL